jgi:BirA family transcriptional regulator, biotin operon repressor / biotin---[acetyl-CoA-carboxylase] ligase
MIDARALKQGLKSRRFGQVVHAFDTIDSTNVYARNLAANGAGEGTVVVAEVQTAGKGRLGRKWVSAPGESLTFSLLIRPVIPPERASLLPLAVAVGVAHGVNQATGLPVCCKWPNDLLLGGKKVAGILMESALGARGLQYVVAGIGINVNQTVFAPELHPRATSLALQAGHPFERLDLFRQILECLERDYEAFAAGGFDNVLAAWLELAPIIGTHVTADQQGERISGRVTGLSPEGGLQLQSDAGDHTLFAGDVTILDMEHYAPRH